MKKMRQFGMSHMTRSLMLAVVICLLSIGNTQVRGQDLIGYWKMDETSDTILADASGYGRDVTLNDNTDAFVDGKFDGAVYFDGVRSAGIDSATSASLAAPSVTYAAYVKADASYTEWEWIAAHGDNVGIKINDTGVPSVYIYIGGWWWKGVDGTTNIKDDQWHHVAGTYDEETYTYKVFLDGALEAEGTIDLEEEGLPGTSIAYNAEGGTDFHIGSMNAERNFHGAIDEVRVYSRALEESEIMDIATSAPQAKELFGYWKMDETSDTILYDATGNGNDVTLNDNTDAFVDGKFDGAVYFDGVRSAGMDSATSASLAAPSVTYAAYVKADASYTEWEWIAAHGDNVGIKINDTGVPSVYIYIGGWWWKGVDGTTNIKDDQWHHVAGTYDEETYTYKVFLDGALEAEGTIDLEEEGLPGTSIAYNAEGGTDFHIGSMNGERNFHGTIDEVRVYSRALEESEIMEIATNGPTGILYRSFQSSELIGNYPNPLSDQTTFRYVVSNPAEVQLAIYNTLGQRIAILVNQRQHANTYEVVWDGTDESGHALQNGVYLYQIRVGSDVDSQKLIISR